MDSELDPLAQEAAEHLDGFTFVQERNGPPWLRAEDGRTIVLTTPSKAKDRVTLTGRYPDGAAGLVSRVDHSITVAKARGGTALAAEVTRRLLPAYSEAFAKAKAAVELETAVREESHALAHRLAAHLPGATVSEGGSYTPVYSYGAINPEISVRSGSSVRWEFTTDTAELAETIAKLIGDYNRAHPKD